MPTDVVMPQMGESIFEGTITRWLKQPGDRITRDEPLLEISTDKVDAEIPAPSSGVLKEILAAVGQTVQVNTVVAVIDDSGPATPPGGSSDKQSSHGGAIPGKDAVTPPGKDTGAAKPPGDGGEAVNVVMPQMGESIFEGTITKWLKKVGEHISRDEPLFEISTDKVDAEIPAPASGVLTEIKAETGKTVQVNTVVAVIGGADAPAAAPFKPAAETPAVKAPVEAPEKEAPEKAPPPALAPASQAASGEAVRTSPLVRKLAAEHNVDLRRISGSGTGGRVTKDDMLALIEHAKSGVPSEPAVGSLGWKSAPATTPAPPAQPGPTPAAGAPSSADTAKPGGMPGSVEPMSVMRKKIAEHMIASRRTSAHVHTVFDVDMTRIVRLREKSKDRFQQTTGLKLTYTPFFIRAVSQGLRAWPVLNSSVEGDNIHYHRDVNIGVAVSLDWGLLVPVIKHADELSFVGLQRALNDLGERARTKKLKPEEVAGGTFTITNPGIFGASFGLPIINQPQVAILDIGAIVKKPVVVTDPEGNDTLAIRSMLTMAIGFDHRVVDGADADRFMMVVKSALENWNQPIE